MMRVATVVMALSLAGAAIAQPQPPASLKCKPPDRPRQVWACSPAPCTARLVWRCELWCKPGHYPTIGDVRANGGKAECVKHGLGG